MGNVPFLECGIAMQFLPVKKRELQIFTFIKLNLFQFINLKRKQRQAASRLFYSRKHGFCKHEFRIVKCKFDLLNM